jgi:hypothetical protein
VSSLANVPQQDLPCRNEKDAFQLRFKDANVVIMKNIYKGILKRVAVIALGTCAVVLAEKRFGLGVTLSPRYGLSPAF